MTAKEIKRTLQSEFVRTLRKPFVDAVKAYGLVKPSDKVAVCISGGKDSMLLALLLQDLQHTVDFDLVFLAMDPGYAPEGRRHLEENAKRLDIPLEIFDTDVLRVAGVHSAEHPCFLCAKMRRGYLYTEARKRGCNKIALGHHYDDAIGTVLMGLIYGGQVQAMLPRVKAKNYDGKYGAKMKYSKKLEQHYMLGGGLIYNNCVLGEADSIEIVCGSRVNTGKITVRYGGETLCEAEVKPTVDVTEFETVTAQFDKAVLAGIDREKPAVFELLMPEQIYILGFRTY